MSPDAGLTLGVLGLTLFAAAREWASLDLLVTAALFFLAAAGVVGLEAALAGFSNPALLTIAGLLVVAGGLRATGVLQDLAPKILGGGGESLRSVLFRLTSTTAAGSAFLSNTALVAMGIPTVLGWARRQDVAASKLLIPLSYASVLGGMCTLIGTSTNVVMDGLLQAEGLRGLGFFELARVGVPLIVLAVGYLTLVSPRLLPGRSGADVPETERRRYLTEMEVRPGSALSGRTVAEAGLRGISGLFLVRMEREKRGVVAPVDPETELAGGDRLSFAGVREEIVELRRRRGLRAVTAGSRDGEEGRQLHEAVVAPGSPLVGTTVREAEFRPRYNAAVVAVHRHGEELDRPLEEITLRAGDTLLLEAGTGFARAFRDSPDFYLVTAVEDSGTLRRERKSVALSILGAVILTAATDLIELPLAAVGGALAMLATGCLRPGEARRSVDWSVLVVIGAAIGLAGALEQSGAAALLGGVLEMAGDALGPPGLLAAVFVGTMLLTEIVVNQAAAALAFPVVITAAAAQGLDPRPLLIAATVAASFSFSTPLSYQTNLMVYGPGGYRFSDFARAGLPLQLLLGSAAVALIWWLWPVAG